MMYFAVPTLFVYRSVGHESYALTVCLVMLCGLFINGPYAVITTAVSNDLGTHKSLKDDTKAKATVGAIIDGIGSLGAACGPLITGWVSDEFGWDQAFFVLMTSCFLASLSLTRLLIKEVRYLYNRVSGRWRKYRKLPDC
ncbi:Putative glycerol-3-phosphate transporter 2 [Geodia barretti]|uniref:Glycerol-3-phosphate transporter 2 n=2 Tax=Geodia barretti TaxID=519541 RepID=A0AA35TRN2_GEOBA|nr:Putative glycerol-3-phosphate transporter 2 [Geodia barretti]